MAINKKPWMASTQPGTYASYAIGDQEEKISAHALWLQKRGLGPDGVLPPVTVKRTGSRTTRASGTYSRESKLLSQPPRTANISSQRPTFLAGALTSYKED